MNIAEEEEVISYEEILSNLVLNGEVTITILSEEDSRVRTGLKNLKAKMNAKLKEEGLAPPDEFLAFISAPSRVFEDYIDLRILLKKKGVITMKKMVVPDTSL